jgi:hypothetical protein
MMPTTATVTLPEQLVVINVGLELFADTLREQQQTVTHVQWEPPAQGDAELLDMLDALL